MNHNKNTYQIRRHYNQWVSNEMLEDCALRFTALKSRRWSCYKVASTALGSISFLALEAIGAAVTLQYGWVNALSAICLVSIIIFLLGIPVALNAARAGVDIDLLTRGAGFGYLGSTITSLIYAGFTFIYFALEAAIMATALKVCFGIPLSLGYLLSSLAIIPIVVYGITMINRIQQATNYIWLLLQLAPFIFLAWQSVSPMDGWEGLGLPDRSDTHSFNWIMFGAASAVVFSLTVQIGEQVDYLRFLPVKSKENKHQWWISLMVAGPGWIVVGAAKMLAGVYLCLLALKQGLNLADATDPVHLYLNAWANWLTPELALAVTGAFVIICQFKINITNSYAGSIAWSNFFSRLTHSHPGRVVWLVFNVVIALMLMELGVYKSLENTLSLYSILGVSWIGAIATDLTINKRLGLSPPRIHFKRAELYDINPVGVGSMAIATCVGFLCYSGYWGPTVQALATYLALLCVVILVPLLAYVTQGKYYLARNTDSASALHHQSLQSTCSICHNEYDIEDLSQCPAYQGTICSLCCSLDIRCEDQCRPNAPFLAQLRVWTQSIMPHHAHSQARWIVLQFLCLLLVAAAVISFIFGLFYLQADVTDAGQINDFPGFVLKLFAALLLLAAIVSWMFLLASESARRARQDTARQNELLHQEISAHEVTEKELHKAREKAEAANQAKSRYIIGLSHELRTPLNSILGYAQLMEQDSELPAQRQNGVRVIRDSAQHLSGLIENLLDISKIEADKLTIQRDRVNLHYFLDQLTQMFGIQAQSAGLKFRVSISAHVPKRVFADEKRLRQILINLLSNAFKYTKQGHVELIVDYKSQVTTFRINDTGVGICETNFSRIFQPFETLPDSNLDMPKGIGLGLTISKLLAKIMGGDLIANSVKGEGSCFTLKLLLPPIVGDINITQYLPDIKKRLVNQKSIVVVDDDENHRSLLADFFEPMGFKVSGFSNATLCLDALETLQADVFMLDISMPLMNGWELAKELRSRCQSPVRILMISALVDDQVQLHAHDSASNNYFVKPLDLYKLFARLQEILELEFTQPPVQTTQSKPAELAHLSANNITNTTNKINENSKNDTLPIELRAQLNNLYRIGHITAINQLLEDSIALQPCPNEFIDKAQELLKCHKIEAFGALLESTSAHSND